MEKEKRLPVSVLKALPEADGEAVHRLFLEEWKGFGRKVIVLDDDPTGVQTVHDVSVYTDWSEQSLAEGIQEEGGLFFVLTNSRSFPEKKTEYEHRLLAERAVKAAAACKEELLFLSRGDSTLRGHYPLELEALRGEVERLTGRKVHGQVLCPYFKEGGRYTINSVHYVREGDWLVPAGQTEFAQDKTFGYKASHLGEYVEEKSGGRYRKEDCICITLSMLREQKPEAITQLLLQADHFQPILVDAADQSDVETFALCLIRAIKAGKEFLIRSAAALPKVLGNNSDRPLLGREELLGEDAAEGGKTGYGGLVLIGSHVEKTTLQLEELKKTRIPVLFLEFDVNTCFREGGLTEETRRIIREAEEGMAAGKTAVVYTSRTLLAPDGMDGEEKLKLSVEISGAVTGVAAGLHHKPAFLIAKGGITSSDVGTKGLLVKKAVVTGQVQPGIPVWRTGPESRFPGLSYIIFPGNVGETDALKKIVEELASVGGTEERSGFACAYASDRREKR